MIHDGVELPKLLPIEKAAEVLGTDTSTVRRWIDDRSISTMRVNGVSAACRSPIDSKPTRRRRGSSFFVWERCWRFYFAMHERTRFAPGEEANASSPTAPPQAETKETPSRPNQRSL